MSGTNIRNFTSNYPGGFNAGVTIRGVPVLNSYAGQSFWVDSVFGSDGNVGTFDRPFATLATASANARIVTNGSIIFVKAGHTETISTATAMTLSNTSAVAAGVGSIAIVGLGTGAQRPLFTLGAATSATINVTTSGWSFTNCQFAGNLASIVSLFTLTTAKDFAVDSCYIYDVATNKNFITIFTLSATNNANDGLTIVNSMINSLPTSGALNLFTAAANIDRVQIEGNNFLYQTTNAGPVIVGSTYNMTDFRMLNNRFNLQNATGTATGYLITTTGTNTGFIDGNFDHSLPTTPLTITASSGFVYGLNYHSDQADLQGYLVPAADS